MILKETEAIEYLKRARSCIHPEDNFSNLQLVKTMLNIEVAFLEHLMLGKNQDMALLSINSTGFPEFESWMTDINNALSLHSGLLKDRARPLLNFLRQLSEVSPKGILEEGKGLSEAVKEESPVFRVLSDLTEKQRLFLTENMYDFPLQINTNWPGLLRTTDGHTPFNYFPPRYRNMIIANVPNASGLKFIDSPREEGRKVPYIVYASLEEHRIGRFRSLIPRVSLAERLSYCPLGYKHFFGKLLERPIFVSSINLFNFLKPVKEILTEKERTTIVLTETNLQNLEPSLIRAYLGIETAGLPSEYIDSFLVALPKLNEVIQNTLKFSGSYLRGKFIYPAQVANFKNTLSKKVNDIFQSLPDDRLRIPLQIALREALGPVMDQAQTVVLPVLASGQTEKPSLLTRMIYKLRS